MIVCLKVEEEVETSRLTPPRAMAHSKARVTYGIHVVVWTITKENFLLKTYCRSSKRSYILSVRKAGCRVDTPS